MTTETLHLLVVEDNALDARSLLRAAARLEVVHTIDVVASGEEALGYLRGEVDHARRPDLVLLDLNLPGKDGHDVLSEVKADADLRRIPVVVLTSSAAESDVLSAYDLGANAYVAKPADLDGWNRIVAIVQDFWLGLAEIPPR